MLIKLINMPFADIAIPSIALTQLKAVVENRFGEKVQVDIHYLNHDFGHYLGPELYNFISLGGSSNNSGLGDWFFAQAAHPKVPDNTKAYLERYGHLIGWDYLRKSGEFLQQKRQGLPAFLDTLMEEYSLADADIVGFTSMFMQNVASLAMARRIKNVNKDIIAVIGGANCETPMGEEIARNFSTFDYVFSGTSLVSFPRLIDCLLSGNRSAAETINGVFTRENCRNKVAAKARVLITDNGSVETVGPIGDELPINETVDLDYDSFLASFQRFFSNAGLKPYLLFETSRGCWWGAKAHCTFCGLNGGGMPYRAMKTELAIGMINRLIDRYGDQVQHFSSVDNIVPREYIRDVFPNITRKAGITMFYEVRADLTAEEMNILSDAGVVEMQPGIESLSTSTLKLMKKGTSAFNNLRFLQHTVTYSVRPHWNLLIGFPGEEEAVYEKYYNDMPSFHHLPPPAGVFAVRFDRYSPYFMEAGKYGLDLHPLEYYYFNYPLSEETLKNMCYYFGDHNYGAKYIEISSKWITRLQTRLMDWRRQWAAVGDRIFPKLFFSRQDGRDLIIDSRYGPARKIMIRPEEKTILTNLDQRKNLDGLRREIPGDAAGLERMVNELTERRFLFQENGTYMNLVFSEEPFLKGTSHFHQQK